MAMNKMYKEVASGKSKETIHDHYRRARMIRRLSHKRWVIRNMFRNLIRNKKR